MMPQSKSSIGEDISSSFVSSATETTIDGGAPPKQGVNHSMTDVTTSMLTSNNSYIMQNGGGGQMPPS